MLEINEKHEFFKFWNDLPLSRKTKNSHYSIMVENEFNYISLLSVMDDSTLINDIGMTSLEAKIFLHNAKQWDLSHNEYRKWLHSISMYDEYYKDLKKYGIFTFDGFYEKITSVDSLFNILLKPKMKQNNNNNENNSNNNNNNNNYLKKYIKSDAIFMFSEFEKYMKKSRMKK